MKKLLILILLLVVACSRQAKKPEIKLNEIIVIEDDKKVNQNKTIYIETKNENTIHKEDEVIIIEREIIETRKSFKPKVVNVNIRMYTFDHLRMYS